jgi:glucose-1-phosphate thymidylyltransferase
MKAVIPVAGAGTNLRPLTYTQPKPLIPVAGKPIISFIVEQLVEMGVRDFVFVIGYLGEKIQNFMEKAYPDLNTTFVTQENRRGSGHAIWTAREEIKGEDEIIIFFGDTIIDADFKTIMESPSSCLGVKRVDDPRKFGVVEYGKDCIVTKVVEKPKIPKSNMAMVGFYKILEVDLLLEVLDKKIQSNSIGEGEEYPLTNGLMSMIERGAKLTVTKVNNWFDCGRKEILLETNATLLDKEGYASSHLPTYDNSIVIHPVSIGENCKITNSIIGPHSTIGDNAVIDSAIVRNSIIGNYASLKEVVLQNSVVGNDTAITGMRQSLNIGDNTEIDFS